jgi:hypothetical protein
MALTQDEFKDWLEKDVHYIHSDQVPTDAIFKRYNDKNDSSYNFSYCNIAF